MNALSFHVLRIGVGITFLWIGVLILQRPEAWGGLMQSWAANLLPISLKWVMIGSGILDVLIGVLLMANIFTRSAAKTATLHLILILIVTGINAITVRDIGLIGATLALSINMWPENKKSE